MATDKKVLDSGNVESKGTEFDTAPTVRMDKKTKTQSAGNVGSSNVNAP